MISISNKTRIQLLFSQTLAEALPGYRSPSSLETKLIVMLKHHLCCLRPYRNAAMLAGKNHTTIRRFQSSTSAFNSTKTSPPSSSINYENTDNTIYTQDPHTQFVSAYQPRPKRIVVAITGATGIAMGIRILEILKELRVETHLVVSKWGMATMKYETDYTFDQVVNLASKVYTAKDVSAPISSGSFLHDGMIVVPCSMKSLAAIRIGYTEDLIIRAADVTLKERRKLLLVTRETPLSDIHLDNMLYLSRMGTIIFPPVPAFYTKPQTINDVIEQSCGRILDCFGIDTNSFPRWDGIKNTKQSKKLK